MVTFCNYIYIVITKLLYIAKYSVLLIIYKEQPIIYKKVLFIVPPWMLLHFVSLVMVGHIL